MNHKITPHLCFRRSAVRVLAVCTTSLLPLVSAVAHASLPGNSIGEVTFVLGKAWIEKPGAQRELIAEGTQIGVFDKIDTGSNSHVHIRFIDNGLYSVRPQSTLEIQRYDYDPANPADSAVKLNLIEGVNRSISGDAAHKARHNYRMNTPIAAIGVRGTDFKVTASRDTVEAQINEGAIVVAPFSNQCLADALGPCNENGLELAYGSAQVLQIANSGGPVLLPMSGSGLPESIIDQSLAQPDSLVAQREEATTNELYPESVTTLAVNQKIAVTLASGPGTPSITPPIDVPPVTPTPPEFTPDAPVAAAALTNSQLVWGRLSRTEQPYDRITVDFQTARAGHRGAIGNGEVALYRLESLPQMQRGIGLVEFSLNSAQATYKSNGVVELLDVTGGLLGIDFEASTFATSLNLRSDSLGAVDFNANGRIRDGGFFQMVTPLQNLGGALSQDNSEAGYYFQKTLESGAIDGLTLWGRQP